MSDPKYTIQLYDYDYDSRERVQLAEVNASQVARCMTHENFVYLFDNYLNYGGKQYPEGVAVGKALQTTHPTLQRSAVAFAIGLLVGISRSSFVDGRNETAIATAKQIAALFENGDLPVGPYL